MFSLPYTLFLALCVSISVWGFTYAATYHEDSTIGGTTVPHELKCQEDEVITFIAIDTLHCVHWEEITP